jgi:hypothetical protein
MREYVLYFLTYRLRVIQLDALGFYMGQNAGRLAAKRNAEI